MQIGVNAWVWTSPLTTEELEKLAPRVKGMGFDWLEVPLESLEDMDHQRGGKILKEYGLGVSTCAAMGEDRDLIHGSWPYMAIDTRRTRPGYRPVGG
jgi:D-psicose/D-tagatose/L-ribulose 3-epimerase